MATAGDQGHDIAGDQNCGMAFMGRHPETASPANQHIHLDGGEALGQHI
jgi:hypothetical protein